MVDTIRAIDIWHDIGTTLPSAKEFYFGSGGRKTIYRARYTGGRGDKGAWVTTVWRRTQREAIEDIDCFAAHPTEQGYDGVEIIEMDYDEYLKKYQRLPKF